MTNPIRPSEIAEAKKKLIPPEIFEVVNELLVLRSTGGRSSINITQNEIIEKVLSKLNIDRTELFSNGYLNFEEAYREYGWEVYYDKPCYNESYDAFFKFTPKR